MQQASAPQQKSMLELGPEQWNTLRETFTRIDVDGSSGLNRKEITGLWEVMWPDCDKTEIKNLAGELFCDIDINGDGEITLKELEAYLLMESDPSDIDKFIADDNVKEEPEDAREWVWAVLDEGGINYTKVPWLGTMRTAVSTLVQVAIMISVVNMMIESLPEFQERDNNDLFVVECTCIAIFTLEFMLRVYSTPDRIQFMKSTLTWIDILAVLPFYVSLAGASSSKVQVLVVLRVLRLLRLMRVVKLGARFQGVQLLLLTMQRAGDALLLSTLVINLVAVTVFASLMFTFERHEASFVEDENMWVRDNDSQYDDAGKRLSFQSIPDSMWWAWVTLTTVGYGDAYPRTPAGKGVASLAMLCGFVLVAFPITLLSNALQATVVDLETRKARKKRKQSFSRRMRIHSSESEDTEYETESRKSSKASRPSLSPRRRRTRYSCSVSPRSRKKSRLSSVTHPFHQQEHPLKKEFFSPDNKELTTDRCLEQVHFVDSDEPSMGTRMTTLETQLNTIILLLKEQAKQTKRREGTMSTAPDSDGSKSDSVP